MSLKTMFLMHRVELKVKRLYCEWAEKSLFLMHRVELKENHPLKGGDNSF